jgi:nicotinamide mononucleotide transporter
METALTIYGYHLTYLELIGSIFNFVSVIFATKANWWNWICSIIGQVCFFFLFWNNSLYANAILQIYFTYICIVAIFYWRKTDKNEGKGLRWLTNKQRLIWSIITIISIFVIDFIVRQILPVEKQSANLFLDITVTVLSILGVNLLSFKYIESWLVWIISDIVCVFLFGFSGIYLVAIESLIFTGTAIYGFINWIKIYNLKKVTL